MSAPPNPAASVWQEYKNEETGRPYWYHTIEKRSVWEKPSEFKTPRELAIESTRWKEYQSGDRKYYVHSDTKESTWQVPAELQQLFDKIDSQPAVRQITPAAASPLVDRTSVPPLAVSPSGPTRPVYSGPPPAVATPTGANNALPSRPGSATPAPIIAPSSPADRGRGNRDRDGNSSFRSKEEAEQAFIALLARTGVDATWNWEKTMRAIITDPLYKALKTLAERKTAFSKYVEDLKRRELEEKQRRKEEMKPIWREEILVKLNGKIKSYSSWETVKKFLKDGELLQRCKNDEEGKELWAMIQKELQEKDDLQAREIRHRNMDMLMSLLKTFEADVFTRWRDAHRTVLESEEFRSDAHLHEMELSDMLIVFDEHMKSIEKETVEDQKIQDAAKKRTERKRRENFDALLSELRESGDLNARTRWGKIYPKVKDDDRFKEILTQSGSSPMDLFYDKIDVMEKDLDDELEIVTEILKRKGKSVEESTSRDEFESWVEGEEGVRKEMFREVFEELSALAIRNAKRAERKLRHQIEDLRYALKKLDPPLGLEDADGGDQSYEKFVPQIQHLREFKDLENEEARRGAWDKHVKRQKEKLEERRELEKKDASANGGENRKRKSAEPSSRRDRGDRRSEKRDREDVSSSKDRSARRVGKTSEAGEEPAKKRSRQDEEDDDREEGEV